MKEEKCKCKETHECECGEICECGDECTCKDDKCHHDVEEKCNCKETHECDCGDECECGDECTCTHDKCHHEEKKEKKKKNKKDKELEEALFLIKDLNDKLLREKAELINYRRRKDEEVSKMLKYSNEDLIMEMLPIIDNFENAIKMDNNNLTDELSKFLEGFKMLYGSLISILEKFGVRSIDGINKPFDPTYHQAVIQEKIEDTESGIVVDVLRKGYILKDKVLRPAMVKVSE